VGLESASTVVSATDARTVIAAREILVSNSITARSTTSSVHHVAVLRPDRRQEKVRESSNFFCHCILTGGTLVSVLERPHSFIVSPSTLLARLARLCRPLLDASSSSASLLLVLSTNPSLNNASNARCLL